MQMTEMAHDTICRNCSWVGIQVYRVVTRGIKCYVCPDCGHDKLEVGTTSNLVGPFVIPPDVEPSQKEIIESAAELLKPVKELPDWWDGLARQGQPMKSMGGAAVIANPGKALEHPYVGNVVDLYNRLIAGQDPQQPQGLKSKDEAIAEAFVKNSGKLGGFIDNLYRGLMTETVPAPAIDLDDYLKDQPVQYAIQNPRAMGILHGTRE